MSSVWSDAVVVRDLACTLALIGVGISSLEWLTPLAKVGPESLLAAECFGSNRFERLWRPHGLRAVFLLRLASVVVWLGSMLMGLDTFASRAMVLAAGLLSLPIRFRPPVGVFVAIDGAEHMFTAILLALGPTFLLTSTVCMKAALAFVAVEALLEYAVSGWSKLTDWRGWVQGPYLRQVFASYNYGHPRAAAFLQASPATAGIVSGALIALELSVVLSVVLPPPLAEALLLLMFGFHLGAAFIMGLNTYFWAFVAAYPAILYCRNLLLGL